MAEPRARLRATGQVFNTADLSDLLYAFGDHVRPQSSQQPQPPLQTTIRCLDEILTDFIIETCHAAALSASYSRRQKIKVDDFKWVLRKDDELLGRVLEQLWRDKKIKDDRKMPGFENIGGEGLEELEGLAEAGGVKGREMRDGKRRRKKRKVRENAAAEAKSAAS